MLQAGKLGRNCIFRVQFRPQRKLDQFRQCLFLLGVATKSTRLLIALLEHICMFSLNLSACALCLDPQTFIVTLCGSLLVILARDCNSQRRSWMLYATSSYLLWLALETCHECQMCFSKALPPALVEGRIKLALSPPLSIEASTSQQLRQPHWRRCWVRVMQLQNNGGRALARQVHGQSERYHAFWTTCTHGIVSLSHCLPNYLSFLLLFSLVSIM